MEESSIRESSIIRQARALISKHPGSIALFCLRYATSKRPSKCSPGVVAKEIADQVVAALFQTQAQLRYLVQEYDKVEDVKRKKELEKSIEDFLNTFGQHKY